MSVGTPNILKAKMLESVPGSATKDCVEGSSEQSKKDRHEELRFNGSILQLSICLEREKEMAVLSSHPSQICLNATAYHPLPVVIVWIIHTALQTLQALLYRLCYMIAKVVSFPYIRTN